jgi:hypothetical protein
MGRRKLETHQNETFYKKSSWLPLIDLDTWENVSCIKTYLYLTYILFIFRTLKKQTTFPPGSLIFFA